MVKIIILRKVAVELERELRPLLLQIRGLAMEQPGYVSGETLMNADNPEEYMVISSWSSIENWNAWLASREREEIQNRIDVLLGSETKYKVYYNG